MKAKEVVQRLRADGVARVEGVVEPEGWGWPGEPVSLRQLQERGGAGIRPTWI